MIPVLNEQGNIAPLYQKIVSVMRDLDCDFELLFVDDGSTDASLQQMQELRQKEARVKILSLSRNFGHQMALTAGMDHATGDACMLMDADLQHPPDIIKELVSRWRQGYEIVFTIRKSTENSGFLKRATARMFYAIFRGLSGIELAANTADFRLLDRKVITAFSGIRERVRFLRGLTGWVGYKTIGVSYRASQRLTGSTKYSFFWMLRLAIDGLTSFTAVPLYLAIYAGVTLTFIGSLYAPYAIYMRFMTHRAVAGWASLMTVVCFIGGLQLLLTGVLGLYIAKIYEEVKQRPLYLVRQSFGVDPAPENRSPFE